MTKENPRLLRNSWYSMLVSSTFILCTCVVVSCVAKHPVRPNAHDIMSSSGSGSESSSEATKETGSGSRTFHYYYYNTHTPLASHSSESKLATKAQMDGGSWPDPEPPIEGPSNPPTGSGSGNQPAPGSGTVPNNPTGGTGSESQQITYPPIKVTGNGNQPVVYPASQSVGAGRPQTVSPCTAPCTQYAVSIRAERHNTILTVYEFTRLAVRPLAVSDVRDLLAEQKTFVTPGMFNPAILLAPTEIVRYLAPLIHVALSLVPTNYHTVTPLFFTVPRYLRSVDIERAYLVTREANRFLDDKYQVPFLIPKKGFATKKAASSWVTINFLRGALKKSTDSRHDPEVKEVQKRKKKTKTVGILNIDAQLRIVMAFDKKVVDSNVTDLIRAWDSVYALVADGSPADFPSILLDYVTTVNNGSIAEVMESPCHHKKFEKNIRFQFIPRRLVGSGNKAKCREILSQVIPEFLLSKIKGYKGRLYTFSTTLEALKAIGCSTCKDGMKYITPALIVKTAKDFCESSSDNIYPCLQSSILIEGLTHRYGLKDNRRIRVLQNVSDIDLDWSLGAILVSMELLEN